MTEKVKRIRRPRSGFASMTPERRREIAAMGGANSGGNFKHNREKAREAGRKGGIVSGRNFKQRKKNVL